MEPTWHPSGYDRRDWQNAQYHCPGNHHQQQASQQQNQWQIQHGVWPNSQQGPQNQVGPDWTYQSSQSGAVVHNSRAEVNPSWNPNLKNAYYPQAIPVPNGWTRSVQGGQVFYSSPSGESLGSSSAVAAYLRRNGTCKCGLPCPLKIEEVFSFDPQVASASWNGAIRPCRSRPPAVVQLSQQSFENSGVVHQVSLQGGQTILLQQQTVQQPNTHRGEQANRVQLQGGMLSQVSEMKAIMPVAPIVAVPALPNSSSSAKSPKKRRRRAAPPQTVASILQRQDPQNHPPVVPQPQPAQMMIAPTVALLPDGRACLVTSAPGQFVLVPANSMPFLLPVGTQKPGSSGVKMGKSAPGAAAQSDNFVRDES
ncbi:methyl-CpG-binding domain protein 6-like isoform X2 [Artemia franciscana]|uniref:methyl-CpG-binding domain protein 6-like isoform X2 n=1 Tax=Artemia franciscana TaxID=6661 RepID=UPI0032D9F08C